MLKLGFLCGLQIKTLSGPLVFILEFRLKASFWLQTSNELLTKQEVFTRVYPFQIITFMR